MGTPTQSLFFELTIPSRDRSHAKWSLKDDDHEFEGVVYPSLKKIYLAMEDPHEYEFVMATIGSWDIWERICNNSRTSPHVDSWRRELDQKLKSKAFAKMKAQVEEGTASHQTLKYLAANEYRESSKRGRPSKKEVEQELKEEVRKKTDYEMDADRLGLRVVK